MSTPKKHYATRDFNDAGTETHFQLGQDVTAEKGLANYVAAGLASDKKPSAAKREAASA